MKPNSDRVEELQQRAAADLQAVMGRVFLAHELSGYMGDDGCDTVFLHFDPPAKVRVVDGITDRWNDEWLDSMWNVDLVEPHPDIPPGSRLSVYGISYSLGGKTEGSRLLGVARPLQ